MTSFSAVISGLSSFTLYGVFITIGNLLVLVSVKLFIYFLVKSIKYYCCRKYYCGFVVFSEVFFSRSSESARRFFRGNWSKYNIYIYIITYIYIYIYIKCKVRYS